MAKISLALLTLISLALLLTAAQAQAISPRQYIRERCNPDTARLSTEMAAGLQDCLQTVYNFIVVIAVALAFIVIIWGAIEYLVGAAANTQQAGKEKIFNALIGLLIIFSSGVVLYWINPQIFTARLILFKVTNLKAPEARINSTEKVITVGSGGTNGTNTNTTAVKLQEPDLSKFNDKECIGKPVKVRITAYYTPAANQFTNQIHMFLSNTTLEGSSVVDNNKVINASIAQEILKETAIYNIKKCNNKARWTWGQDPNVGSERCLGGQAQPGPSSAKNEKVIKVDKALTLIKNKAGRGTPAGAKGPIYPLKTAAINKSGSVFSMNDLIKILDCGDNCNLKGKVLWITDTGSFAVNQIDVYAGIGEEAKTKIQKSDWGQACKVGKGQPS